MSKSKEPEPIVKHAPGCKGAVHVSRAERIPGKFDCTALCTQCGASEGWTEAKPVEA